MRAILLSAAVILTLMPTSNATAQSAGTAPSGPPPAMPQIFVSPFGEIFTAEEGHPYPVLNWFSGADTDADQILSYAEFAADGARWFALLDKDSDGQLSYSELNAYESERGASLGPQGRAPSRPQDRPQGAPPPSGGRGPQGSPPGGRGGAPGGGNLVAMAGLLGVREPVKSADTNTSQSVTSQEWEAVTRRWFTLLDSNRDGQLAFEELPKTQLQQATGNPRRQRR